MPLCLTTIVPGRTASPSNLLTPSLFALLSAAIATASSTFLMGHLLPPPPYSLFFGPYVGQ